MVYILLGTGFEEMEATAPFDILKRGGVHVSFVSVGEKIVTGAHGIKITADITLGEADFASAEMVIVPGGLGGVEAIEKSREALDGIMLAYHSGAEIAAICAGPRVLAKLGLINGVRAVCYPGMENEMCLAKMTQVSPVQRDGKITTGRGPGACIDFGLKLLEVLRGSASARRVAGDMHYDR